MSDRTSYTVSDRRKQNMMILDKCIHNFAPEYLRNMFSVRDHVKNLRGVNKIVIPSVNTTRYGLNIPSLIPLLQFGTHYRTAQVL